MHYFCLDCITWCQVLFTLALFLFFHSYEMQWLGIKFFFFIHLQINCESSLCSYLFYFLIYHTGKVFFSISLVILVQRLLQIMGYKSYAEFALQPTMASSPEVVMEFLLELSNIVNTRADEVLLVYLDNSRIWNFWVLIISFNLGGGDHKESQISSLRRCQYRCTAMGWSILQRNDQVFSLWNESSGNLFLA